VSLVRTSIGPIDLGSLPEGKWRPLSEDEFRKIFISGKVKRRRKEKEIDHFDD